MKREIKYRAWDVFNDCYTYSNKAANLAQFFTRCQALIEGGNKLIFEQFTGLKDKNGKEIYEGDVTQDTYHINNEEYKSGIQIVYWDSNNCSFSIKPSRPYGYSPLYYSDKREVVGNIHENPELLKQK